MRKVFCLLVIAFSINEGISQFNLIAEKTNGICYLGMDNPLYLCSSEATLSGIELKTNNGKIVKSEERLFIYKPDLLGKAVIKIHKKGKEVASYHFLVENINLTASIGDKKSNDSISAEYLSSNKRLIVNLPSTIVCLEGVKFVIKEFRTIIFRGDSLLYNIKNNGSVFSDEAMKIFSNLTLADRITFVKIKVDGPSGQFELEDIHYYIKK